jgi:hypothetical protein
VPGGCYIPGAKPESAHNPTSGSEAAQQWS